MADLPPNSMSGDAANGSPAPPAARTPLVPEWLINIAALGWRVLVIAALILVVWLVSSTLWVATASVAVAIVVSAVLAPFVLRLRAEGRTRTAAASIVWVAALLVAFGVLAVLVLALLPDAVQLVGAIEAGLAELNARLAELQVPAIVGTVVRDVIGAVRASTGGFVGGVVASAASVVTVAILASFLMFFFLRDGDKAWVWIFQGLGNEKRERITAAGDNALTRVGGYLRGTTVLSALIALTDFVFMLLLGVPLAVPLSLLAFLAGYIPYFGGIVTTAIILLVTLATQGPVTVLILLVLIGLRNVVLGYLVRPTIYGRTVSIHPALVLIVLPAGYELAGIIGLFAAVPLTAVILAVAGATVAIVDPDPRPQLPGMVPAWLDRVAQWGWRILVVTGLVALVVAVVLVVPLVVIPLVLAIILAATLEPTVRWLIGRGQARTRAAATAVAGGFLLIAAILVLATVSLADQADEVASTATAGAASVSAALGGHLDLGTDAVAGGTLVAVRTIVSLIQGAAAVAIVTLLGGLLTFYFLRDGGRLWGRLVARVPNDVRADVDAAGTRAFDVLGGYMIGTAAISFVGAASQLVIMVILGIPLALPVFVLSFFLCFIPYIGGFISTGIAFLLTVVAGSSLDVAIMAIWTIVFNIVQGNVVSPLVYGRTVHLHPAIVLVGIPAGSAVAGIVGMFLVVPAMGVVAATWRTVLAVIGARAERAGAPKEPGRTIASAADAPDLAPLS